MNKGINLVTVFFNYYLKLDKNGYMYIYRPTLKKNHKRVEMMMG